MSDAGSIHIIRMIIEDVFRAILHKADKQKPIKDYSKSTTYKCRGGAWFLIVVCVLCIGMMVWSMVLGDIKNEGWWAYVFIIVIIVLMGFVLRYAIHMLKAEIHIDPNMLVLDGAVEERPYSKFRKWLHEEIVGLTPGQFIVEIPWCDIHCIEFLCGNYRLAGMRVETKSHERYYMNIAYFDISMVSEIKKYCSRTTIN